jgi:methionyl-tRNA formyltransferase
MRILFLANNWVGWRIGRWLREQGEDIVGLVVHPPGKRKYGEEIMKSAGLAEPFVFDGTDLERPRTLAAIRALGADIGVSALFGYILRPEILKLMPAGCVNIHPGLLPDNRGACPNVWNIVEGTPAGATLHYMDAGVDTGDVISQLEVPVTPLDTGESLYRKLEQACVDLFKETWPLVRSGKPPRVAQDKEAGATHRTSDVKKIDEIKLDRRYTARELINVLRARTFSPYPGAFIVHEGRNIYLRIQLQYAEDLGKTED